MRQVITRLIVVLFVTAAACCTAQSPAGRGDSAVFNHLVYIGVEEVDLALGCPARKYGCFYTFFAAAGPGTSDPRHTRTCHRVRRNCNEFGECIKTRDWCIVRRGLPAWLLRRYPGRWTAEARPTYLLGRTDLLNPTHIASLHFLPLMRWMDVERVAPGQVLMIWDNVRSAGPGAYGLGLAAALGETRWLPHMTGPIVFRHIRLGEHGDLRFPYPLDRRAPTLQPDAAFQRLAAVVKRHHSRQQSPMPRSLVVIARRRHTRILANAVELQSRLSTAGVRADILDFGSMSFGAQVAAMHEAAVLVSVHGADCMNLMFLPHRGCLVEVLPTHYGYGQRNVMQKGDYFNLARLLGKQYMQVISTSASTIIRDASGQLADWNHVNFVGNVTVDLDAIVPAVLSAVALVRNGNP